MDKYREIQRNTCTTHLTTRILHCWMFACLFSLLNCTLFCEDQQLGCKAQLEMTFAISTTQWCHYDPPKLQGPSFVSLATLNQTPLSIYLPNICDNGWAYLIFSVILYQSHSGEHFYSCWIELSWMTIAGTSIVNCEVSMRYLISLDIYN